MTGPTRPAATPIPATTIPATTRKPAPERNTRSTATGPTAELTATARIPSSAPESSTARSPLSDGRHPRLPSRHPGQDPGARRRTDHRRGPGGPLRTRYAMHGAWRNSPHHRRERGTEAGRQREGDRHDRLRMPGLQRRTPERAAGQPPAPAVHVEP